ncbi:MAG: helix-turn-helix transcriptional regulator [Spirochaetota bacterium]
MAQEAIRTGEALFVGRERERRLLSGALAKARAGQGSAALLEGEAGAGKSRFACEFAREALDAGFIVAHVRCFEGESSGAYGVWADVLRECARAIASERFTLPSDLRSIVTAVAAGPGDGANSERERRQCVTDAILETLRSVSDPLLIIIDNLHLAEASSLRVLRHLTPLLWERKIMVLATCREEGAERRSELLLTLDELTRARAFLRIRLGGLCRDEVAALISGVTHEGPDSELVEAVFDRTEGNPLFVVEVARDIAHRKENPSTSQLAVPTGIVDTVERRLFGVSEQCRIHLRRAAALGRTVEVGLLSSLFGYERARELCDEAVAAGLLRVEPDQPGLYRFSHEVVRQAILSRLPLEEQERMHLRAADALAVLEAVDSHARSKTILRHLLAAGAQAPPDRLLIQALQSADQALRMFAPEDALQIIDETVNAWERSGRLVDGRIAELLHRRALVLTDLDRPAEAEACYIRAFDLYLAEGRRDDAIRVATSPAVERYAARDWIGTALGGRGVQALRGRAINLARPGSREYAQLLVQRAARSDLVEAIEIARRIGDLGIETTATTGLAYHDYLAYEISTSSIALARAEELANRLGTRRELLGCAYTRLGIAVARLEPGGIEEALTNLGETTRRARSRHWLATYHRCELLHAMNTGTWDDGRRHGRECLEILRTCDGPVFNRIQALAALARIEEQQGNMRSARRRWDEIAAARGQPVHPGSVVRLEVALVTGDCSHVSPPSANISAPDTEAPLLVFAPLKVCEAAASAILLKDRRVAELCLEPLGRWHGLFMHRPFDTLIGLLLSLLGRPDEAVAHLEAAASLCSAVGFRPHEAFARYSLAKALLERHGDGDDERAEAELAAALSTCRLIRMKPLSRAVLSLLDSVSGRRHKTRCSADNLTYREVEILPYLAGGFANADIGAMLHISGATVARHVHNLLEKTGATNRAELSAWAARSGLLDDGR